MSLNIIIPLGGTGERFKEGGYRVPKPLINVLGEPMISRVLNSLSLSEDDRVFVFYNKDLDDFGFSDIMERHHPNVQLVAVPNNTTGPVDTLYRGILNLANTEWNKYAPTVVLDGDTFYTEDILQTYRATCDSRIFYSPQPHILIHRIRCHSICTYGTGCKGHFRCHSIYTCGNKCKGKGKNIRLGQYGMLLF